jgi:hypothetical protein
MEQKAAHTPGPWNCNRSSASGYDIVCSENSPTDVCVISRRDKTTGEIDANARLIAAAPELLAALETAYMALIGYLPAHRNDVTDAAIGAARAAITKATGEAA